MLVFSLALFFRYNFGKMLAVLLGLIPITGNAFAVSKEIASASGIQYKIISNQSDTVTFLVASVIVLASVVTYYKVSNVGRYDTFSVKCKKCGQKTRGLKCITCGRKNPAK